MKECAFCKAGTTNVFSLGNSAMTEKVVSMGGLKVHYVVEHWCSPIDGANFRTISFYGRTEQEAIDLWNNRPDVTNGK